MLRKCFVLVLASVGASVVPFSTVAQGRDISFSYGAEYSTGKYGTSQETDIWYFPFAFEYDADRFTVSLTAPLMMVNGPGSIVAGGDSRGLPSGRAPGTSDTEVGVGDIQLRGSVNLALEDNNRPRIDLTGKIKFGTADRDKNLGTGEDDFAVQVDAERTYAGAGLFGALGYKLLGDPPGVNYKNPFYVRLGAALRVSDTTSVGAAFDAQEEVLSGTPAQRDLTLFLSSRADPRTKITGYVLKGLRDGSPDWGVGIMVKLQQ